MNSLEKLHQHHERLITTIMDLAERSKKVPSDTSLLISFCNEFLLSHAEAEEKSLYTAYDDSHFVDHMIQEHQEIKNRLDSIEGDFSSGDSQSLLGRIDGFTDLLENHFNEEEDILMPRLGEKLSQQEFDSLIERTHLVESERKKSDIWSLFKLDHKRIDLNISALLASKKEETIKDLYSKIKAQLLKHIELEETLLFTSFAKNADQSQTAPVRVMISEHIEIVSHISSPVEATDAATMLSNIHTLVGKLATHNKKEELVLYPLINRTLPREEKRKVFGDSMEQLRKV